MPSQILFFFFCNVMSSIINYCQYVFQFHMTQKSILSEFVLLPMNIEYLVFIFS
uniref:Uncharacterized protein n=1 Tax=Lepeophtheirus salmonis TaxID=72036 RepID=A0A0K2TFD6_LEPSM